MAGVGLATGALTQVGQSILPEGWSQAANAISTWLLVAFLLGAKMPSAWWAAGAGIASLLLALVGYYAMTELRYGIGGGTGSLVLWGTGALVGGPVFGIAGRWWRVGDLRRRSAAIGLLAAVAIAEGVYNAWILGAPAVGAGFVIVGLLVPLVLGHSRDERLWGYVATIPGLLLGVLGYIALLGLSGLNAAV